MKIKDVKSKYQRIKGGWIASSLLCILFGLILCIWPDVVANTASYILGGIILVVGIIYLALCLWAKEKNFVVGFGIVFSVILIAIGVFMFLKPEVVLSLFPMIIGGIIVIHGIADLKYSIEFAASKYSHWWVALIISIATIGLGVLVLFNPFKAITLTFRIIGIVLMADGISEFWIGFQMKKLVPNAEVIDSKTDVIEVKAREK